jgi:hypothetical protein
MPLNGHGTRTQQEHGPLNGASSELPRPDNLLVNHSNTQKHAFEPTGKPVLAAQGLVKSANNEAAATKTIDAEHIHRLEPAPTPPSQFQKRKAHSGPSGVKTLHDNKDKNVEKKVAEKKGFWPVRFFVDLSQRRAAARPSWKLPMDLSLGRRRAVVKAQVDNKKSILISPQRRHELDRLLAFRKRKRHRVHFFIPQNKRVVFLRMMEPNNKSVQRWLALMVLPLVYEAWSLPYRLALDEPSISSGLFIADIIVDSLMVVRNSRRVASS